MTKFRKRIATGLKVSDILQMTESKLQSYSVSEQREIVSRVASAANKRLKNLQAKEVITPATIRLQQSGGKISVKGKSGDDLINEFNRAKRFLKSKTSSITGWKKEVKRVENQASELMASGKLKIQKGMKSNEIIANAFAIFDVLSETSPELVVARDRYKIAEHIANIYVDSQDVGNIILKTTEWLETEYQETQRRYDRLQEETSLGKQLNDDIPRRYKRKRKKRR